MKSKFLYLIFLLLIWSSNSFSQLRIEITGGTEEPIRIAVVPLNWNISGKPKFYFQEVIKKDLESFGEFFVMNPEDMLSLPAHDDQLYFRDWKLLDIDYLVTGVVNESSEYEEINISYSIFNVNREKIIHRAVLSGSLGSLRRMGHNISDKIYEKINGIPGIFSTRIAYINKTSEPKDSYHLRITDIDGDNDISLFNSPEPLLSPSWSPSGDRIAYVSFEEGSSRIYIQELSSGVRKPLKHEEGINSSPNWSPKNRFISAVLSKNGNPDIFLYDLKKDEWEQMTYHYGIDTEPDWSPNGKSILFTSNRSGSPQIYEMNISTKKVKRRTFNGSYNARGRYLPNGKSIVYVHRDDGVFHIAIQSLKSGRISILTDTVLDESPSVSPNGNVIVYATKLGEKGLLAGITIDGKTRFMLPSFFGETREPSWSPILDK